MCGIFGVISTAAVSPADVQALAKHVQQRGWNCNLPNLGKVQVPEC